MQDIATEVWQLLTATLSDSVLNDKNQGVFLIKSLCIFEIALFFFKPTTNQDKNQGSDIAAGAGCK